MGVGMGNQRRATSEKAKQLKMLKIYAVSSNHKILTQFLQGRILSFDV